MLQDTSEEEFGFFSSVFYPLDNSIFWVRLVHLKKRILWNECDMNKSGELKNEKIPKKTDVDEKRIQL